MARPSFESPADRPVVGWIARNERKLIVVWLGGCAALLAGIGVWGLALNGAERWVDGLDADWIARLDAAQELVARGEWERAESELERLDTDSPVTFIKHHLDRERERQLVLLGQVYVERDKKRLARQTFERLVAFDPRNYDNHFRRAEALRAIGDADARAAYEEVLRIHPTHLPSVAALMDMSFDAGRYAPVVETFERYLDAWILAPMRVRAGEASVVLEIPVDGSVHTLEADLILPENWSGVLELETGGFSAEIEHLELIAPLRVGVADSAPVLRLVPTEAWTVSDAKRLGNSSWSAQTRASKLTSTQIVLPAGAARLRVNMRVFKSVTDEMWTQATKSYANRLEHGLWIEVGRRARVGGAPEAGSEFLDE